jgi:hypothetical protein
VIAPSSHNSLAVVKLLTSKATSGSNAPADATGCPANGWHELLNLSMAKVVLTLIKKIQVIILPFAKNVHFLLYL